MWSPVATGVAAISVILAATVTGFAVTGNTAPSAPARAVAGGSSGARPPSSAADAAPVVYRSCWVDGATGNVTLSTSQAQGLTTRAARLLARHRSPAALAVEVRASTGQSPTAALAVARGLMGEPGARRLTCSFPRADLEPEKPGPRGLTPRAARLRRAWAEVFGPLVAGGFARGGVHSGHVDNSAHYEGRAVDVFFRPYDSAAQHRRGWTFAQWLVAHAETYGVLSVIYSDHIWTSWASALGFRAYQHPGRPTRNPVLRHLDHVHVAEESGRPFRPR